jgi:hypothetical protein
MRFVSTFVLSFIIATPAFAQVDDDFALAAKIFGKITPAATIEDLDGEWLPLSTLANLAGTDPNSGLAADLLERFCNNSPARGAIVAEIDETSFTMTTSNPRGELAYRFDWIGGSLFHRSFDPSALFSLGGLDTMEGERGVEMRATLLGETTSQLNIYRVSADMIVLAEPQRVEIFGRCAQ